MDEESKEKTSIIGLWFLMFWMAGFVLCVVPGCGHEPTNPCSRATPLSWNPKMAPVQLPGNGGELGDQMSVRIPDSSPAPNPDTFSPFPVSTKDAEWLFHPLILDAACKHQVDQALIKAIIMTESEFNAKAVSKHGAMGLMQIMPRTAKALGVEDPLDPFDNIHGGARYLRELLDEFKGNTRLALAAYNAGSIRVKEYRGVPPFEGTIQFVQKVLKYQRQFKRTILYQPNDA